MIIFRRPHVFGQIQSKKSLHSRCHECFQKILQHLAGCSEIVFAPDAFFMISVGECFSHFHIHAALMNTSRFLCPSRGRQVIFGFTLTVRNPPEIEPCDVRLKRRSIRCHVFGFPSLQPVLLIPTQPNGRSAAD